MTPSLRQELQLALAKCIYTTGSSVRIVENLFFREFVQMMCPEFVFPCRARVATDLLKSMHDSLKEEVKNEHKHVPFVTIVTDGWTNFNNECIVSFMVVTPMTKPVLWKSICIEAASVTAEYMFDRIKEVITELDKEIGAGKVVAVLSDNCKVMQALHDLLEEEYPGLVCYGCAAHMMDLVVKDMRDMTFIETGVEAAVKVSKVIKNRTALVNTFRKIQKSKPESNQHGLKLPGTTRWYSSQACLLGYTQNKWAIRALFSQEDLIKRYENTPANKQKIKDIKALIRDDAMWEKTSVACDLMDPVNRALAILEKDNATPSTVYFLFKELIHHETYASAPAVKYNCDEAPSGFPDFGAPQD